MVDRAGMRQTRARSLSLALALALGLVGASGCVTSLSQQALETRLAAVESEVRGLVGPRLFPIYAGTRMEAMTLLADALTEPRRRISLDLAQQIGLAKSRRVHFVVGGPYAALNGQIVRNALDYHEGRPLPGLVLVLVSPEQPAVELGALAKSKRVQLIHRPLELP